jgi:hypothetical protein
MANRGLITVEMNEMGSNGGLFGMDNYGRPLVPLVELQRRRRVREGAEEPTWRDHMSDAIARCHRDGDHERAMALARDLARFDGNMEEEDEPEGPEDLDDEDNSARGEPFKKYGVTNDGPRSPKGKQNMESLQRRQARRELALRESREKAQRKKDAYWLGRLLRSMR